MRGDVKTHRTRASDTGGAAAFGRRWPLTHRVELLLRLEFTLVHILELLQRIIQGGRKAKLEFPYAFAHSSLATSTIESSPSPIRPRHKRRLRRRATKDPGSSALRIHKGSPTRSHRTVKVAQPGSLSSASEDNRR